MSSRPYTAERQRRPAPGPEKGAPGGELDQVLAHLVELERRLEAAHDGGAELDLDDADRQEVADRMPPNPPGNPAVSDQRIAHTLAELAVLRRKDDQDRDQLTSAALELDQVVRSTEQATFSILGAVETVEQMIDDLLGLVSGDAVVEELISQAQGRLVEIYQASGFQDLTGQRIGKVARTLRFLDERIARLEEIWTREEAALPDVADQAVEDDESHLLNGPQMDDQALSQDDIDAMFD